MKCEIRLAHATGEENVARGRHNQQTSLGTNVDEERGQSCWHPRWDEGMPSPSPRQASPRKQGREVKPTGTGDLVPVGDLPPERCVQTHTTLTPDGGFQTVALVRLFQ